MALQLASMLEGVAMRKDWQESCVKCMNDYFAGIQVMQEYNVMVTLARRSYVFCSDVNGRLQVSVPDTGKPALDAFTKAQVRVVFDPDAFQAYYAKKDGWVDEMVLKRKIRFEGDTLQLESFDEEIGFRVIAIERKFEASGPGTEAILEEQAKASERFEKEAEEERLRKVEAILESSEKYEPIIEYEEQPYQTEDMAKKDYFAIPLKIRLTIAGLVDKSSSTKWEQMDWFERLALAQKLMPAPDLDTVETQLELENATDTLALPENLYHLSTPPTMDLRGFVMWSAATTMFGNMGQANYAAANCILDALVFLKKIDQRSGDMRVAVMQGMVAGLGMRQKAFGSADFALQDAGMSALMLDYIEEGSCIWHVISGVAPEWVTISLFDPLMVAGINQAPSPPRDPDPWRFGKGKGGGLSFDSDDGFEGVQRAVTEQQSLSAGRRVQICGLVKAPHMNGVKCTLIKEVEEGKWQVRLDGDLGDKVLKVEHMKPFADEATNSTCKSDIGTRDFCLAGTWCDWMPQDMRWDSEAGCHVLDVEIEGARCPAGFDVAKGKAGTTRWKKQKQQWQLKESGKYQIQLFCKRGGTLDRVDCKRIGHL